MNIQNDLEFMEKQCDLVTSKYNKIYNRYGSYKKSQLPLLPPEVLDMKLTNDKIIGEVRVLDIKLDKILNKDIMEQKDLEDLVDFSKNLENKSKNYNLLLSELNINDIIENVEWIDEKNREEKLKNKNTIIVESFGILEVPENSATVEPFIIKDYIRNLSNGVDTTQKVDTVEAWNPFSGMISFFKGIFSKIGAVFKKIFEKIKAGFQTMAKSIKEISIKIGKVFKKIFEVFFGIIKNVFTTIFGVIKWWTQFIVALFKFIAWFVTVVVGNFLKAPLGTILFFIITFFMTELFIKTFTGTVTPFYPVILLSLGGTLYMLIEELEALKNIQNWFVELFLQILINPISKWWFGFNDSDDFMVSWKNMKKSTTSNEKIKYLWETIFKLLLFLLESLFKGVIYFILLGYILKIILVDTPSLIFEELKNKYIVGGVITS